MFRSVTGLYNTLRAHFHARCLEFHRVLPYAYCDFCEHTQKRAQFSSCVANDNIVFFRMCSRKSSGSDTEPRCLEQNRGLRAEHYPVNRLSVHCWNSGVRNNSTVLGRFYSYDTCPLFKLIWLVFKWGNHVWRVHVTRVDVGLLTLNKFVVILTTAPWLICFTRMSSLMLMTLPS